ncbi:hypothetical protein PsorP6_000403 [Peronosclerospora sorghi]|uniref:Uncharacterized protein n=1 Tax=Peronosclerospora sorghi TaxID=230839 RepID=A0ACC0WUR6_9STRA|nr:hypothetical protein PsorP6_000403 [Peronosclerospora sorghi]
MFGKPVKASGNILLKNKDVKKLRRDIYECFRSSIKSSEDAKLVQLLPSKVSVKKLSFQAPSRVVVYMVEDRKEPLVFDMTGKGDLCFSVYALWHVPALLPRLIVHAAVSEFVLRGADVMLPGVVFTSEEELQQLHKGELRAIYAQGNPCALGVGEMLVDVADVARNGKKGKALKLLHVVGDALWQLGPQTLPNKGFLGDRVVPVDDDKEEEKDVVDVTSLGEIRLEERVEVEENNQVTKEQMDCYYVAALLQALRTYFIREKDLPMLASSFHANVLLPCRRAGVSLNIKHSSFKKLSVFLKAMEAHGLLKVVDNDGVQSITSISSRHPDVLSHEAYQTAEEDQQAEELATNKSTGLAAFVPGLYAPEVEESVGLSPALKSLLLSSSSNSLAGKPLQKYWSAIEIRDLLSKYVESQGLVDAVDKKFVRLDGPLCDALYGKKAPVGGYPERLARPDILNLLLSKSIRYHRVKLFPTHAAKFHGGSFRPISIHVAKLKRRNNVIVTHVAFYEQFGIDGAAFVKETQKKWGCSATVQLSEDKSKGQEIQIHGHMANEVLNYLGSKFRIYAKYCNVTYAKEMKARKKH